MNQYNYLLDNQFLVELDKHREREVYARVIALTFDEQPVETIEGQITSGSVNIDGASAVRRTCSLSMVAKELNINDFYWGLKSKFKLEIGLKNTIKDYIYDETRELKWGDKYSQDIIWFPMGLYAITTFNTSQSVNNYTVSISGKDKMCFLNGDLGGSLPASIDFGVEEIIDENSNITYYKIPLVKVIREAVHIYANEPYHNIIINDMDDGAVELLEYRGDTPLYMLRNAMTGEEQGFENFTTVGTKTCVIAETGETITLADIPIYDPRLTVAPEMGIIPTEIYFPGSENIRYTVAKIEYGQTAGYRSTDLTFNGDLISSIGESLTSILDKIKKMLGDFEYFYNLDGQFVWQRKQTYVNISWNNISKVGDEKYADNAAYTSSYTYYFGDGNLVTSFQNSPNLTNLKNDYSVWGKRKGVSGIEIPIHYRYAIDIKPTSYTSLIDGTTYISDNYDWRELIYQMALDFYQHGDEDDFLFRVAAANKGKGFEGEDLYPSGRTGYEQYYIDMQGFWRELYNPNPENIYIDYDSKNNIYDDTNAFTTNEDLYVKGRYVTAILEDNIEDLYMYNHNDGCLYPLIDGFPLDGSISGFIDYNSSFVDGVSTEYFLPAGDNQAPQAIPENRKNAVDKRQILVKSKNYIPLDSAIKSYITNNIEDYYRFEPEGYYRVQSISDPYIKGLYFSASMGDLYYKSMRQYILLVDGSHASDAVIQNPITYCVADSEYFTENDTEYADKLHWHKNIINSPTTLNFWFDFLDANSELGQFSVKAVGDRTKAVNDNSVTSIYFREVPNVLFTSRDKYTEYEKNQTGYSVVFIQPGLESMFSISAQGKSAKDAIEELLYNHSYCIENITVSAVPVYYLQPDTRIFIKDDASKINGEYIVSKLTIPLAYNGMMSITATKAPQRIY